MQRRIKDPVKIYNETFLPTQLTAKCIQNTSLHLLRSFKRMCSVKKVLLKISQNSQENTCAKISFLIKFHGPHPETLLKRDSDTGTFCEFCNIFKNIFSYSTALGNYFFNNTNQRSSWDTKVNQLLILHLVPCALLE